MTGPRQAKFDEIKGYKTYDSAQRRGEEVAALLLDLDYRWVVIALPSGRYAPMVIVNDRLPGGPGPFLGLLNVCMCN